MGLDAAGVTQLARNLVGLPQDEAIRALRKCILASHRIDASLLDAALDAKREALRGDGLLETIRRDTSFSDVAGLKRMRERDRQAQERTDSGGTTSPGWSHQKGY